MKYRRTRVLVLHEGQTLEELDLWPGDKVLYGADFTLLGTVNSCGVFVSELSMLN